eukprot:CAMPEP_0203889894 /NCGR_PEP_ID=MMETSP0359-20131031/33403_1 /ASSEMBLY_ACC=CAM_ASM_000338 /TAXON_ID=268821 /ORGANISM="Scrippsiella Hangoei, Strain SHTV-5" /LENGTH=182 /DNA_ID=CAMNT_0050811401 /DNA_START=159 /DNA_END=708 /DNA_ORIENTATION=-
MPLPLSGADRHCSTAPRAEAAGASELPRGDPGAAPTAPGSYDALGQVLQDVAANGREEFSESGVCNQASHDLMVVAVVFAKGTRHRISKHPKIILNVEALPLMLLNVPVADRHELDGFRGQGRQRRRAGRPSRAHASSAWWHAHERRPGSQRLQRNFAFDEVPNVGPSSIRELPLQMVVEHI